jgi:hypothetical protein
MASLARSASLPLSSESARAHRAADKVGAIARHLAYGSSTSEAGSPADDVLIVAAVRTPIGKAKRGAFKATPPDVLLRTVLKAVVDKAQVPMHAIGDICVGQWLPPRLPNNAMNRCSCRKCIASGGGG